MEDGERSLLPPRESCSQKRRKQKRREKKEKNEGKGRKKLSPSLGGPRGKKEREKAKGRFFGKREATYSKILTSNVELSDNWKIFVSGTYLGSNSFANNSPNFISIESRTNESTHCRQTGSEWNWQGVFSSRYVYRWQVSRCLAIFKHCRVEYVGPSNVPEDHI